MKLQVYWLLFVFLAAAPGIAAQDWGPTYTVSGTVDTMTGRPLAGVQVEIRQLLTGRTIATTLSQENGSFQLSNIPRGRYEVVAIAGLDEARESVDAAFGNGFVHLRILRPVGEVGGPATTSVAQLKVPKAAQKIFRKAEQAFSRGRIEEARQQVDQALATFPAYAAALTLRAAIQLQQGQPEPARRDAEQAIAFDASYGIGYLVLASAYNQLARFDDALRTLSQGVRLQSAAWQAYFEMSRAMLGKGDYPAALRQADRAWDLCPAKFSPILLVRAQAQLAMKDYEPAATALEQYLQSDPNGSSASQVRQALDQVRSFLTSRTPR